ncbi:Fe-S cluster assembly protein SufB [Formicincola oecophyllae]|uniref:Fe-S cluster assembly protein SufB n=1 Tax=Formicincola oecophyllae TaxID=2558361 RepID=A0A4Y6U727_9PROT|nr:Fe-S cluster assembly protein SufB [Formicincola oecophyllae]QDH12974.1 Fe-S cluster assembly protein SufB [Formicincola oecophyllae]
MTRKPAQGDSGPSGQDVESLVGDGGYKWGFETDIPMDIAPKGLNEGIIRFISARKGEPEWMLNWRLKAYQTWLGMKEPHWAHLNIPPIDFQDAHYFAQPKKAGTGPKSLDEVDPELLRTYEKLGIPLHEREILAGVEGAAERQAAEKAASLGGKGGQGASEGSAAPQRKVAVDAVFDSVSVATTFRKELERAGVIFCPMSEAIIKYPDLIKKYMGSVVPVGDNFFSALNAAVFTDGTFVYVPEGVRCPMELSTYFRINARNTGQFERTLIICCDRASVSYLEGCTAPQRDENQLHAAVVELVAMEDASIKYSTVQNWYPGDAEGRGGVYNFVTKRGLCKGARARISWTQVETGSAITWKYPSCILAGEGAVGEFYSVAVTNNHQQADTGTKMIHLAPNTRSTIIAKTISAGHSDSTYRGLVKMMPRARRARNFTQCDSLLIGGECGAHTAPYIESRSMTGHIEHEATTSKISDDQLFYCRSRGFSEEEAVGMLVNGFCRDVLHELPMEFAVEAQKLLQVSLEGSVG